MILFRVSRKETTIACSVLRIPDISVDFVSPNIPEKGLIFTLPQGEIYKIYSPCANSVLYFYDQVKLGNVRKIELRLLEDSEYVLRWMDKYSDIPTVILGNVIR